MNLLDIAQVIRKVRQSQGLTVEQLAQRSGFSKGFISQVENFRQTPSLKALIKIAESLGVPLSLFFEDDGHSTPQYSFGHLDEGTEINRDNGEEYGIRYYALAFKQLGRKLDPIMVEYSPASPRDFMSHDSEEFFILLEGELDYYLYDDKNCHRMHKGDTLYLMANIPHRVQLPADCPKARGLIIYSDPGYGENLH